jgi:hypothetical protein
VQEVRRAEAAAAAGDGTAGGWGLAGPEEVEAEQAVTTLSATMDKVAGTSLLASTATSVWSDAPTGGSCPLVDTYTRRVAASRQWSARAMAPTPVTAHCGREKRSPP